MMPGVRFNGRLIFNLLILALLSSCNQRSSQTSLQKRDFSVPGYPDFIVQEGKSIWVLNTGKVEKWGLNGRQASVAVPDGCGAMAVLGRSLWVAGCKTGNLYRIDLRALRLDRSIQTGVGDRDGELNVVAGDGSIWLPVSPSGRIARVDPTSLKVVASIPVDPGSNYAAFGFGALWVASGKTGQLQRIDPRTNRVDASITLKGRPGFLAAGENAIWVQLQEAGSVVKVDPGSMGVLGSVKVSDRLPYGDIDAANGSIWLRTSKDQTLVRIDPTSLRIEARLGLASGSGAVRVNSEGVWTSAHDQKTVSLWRQR